MAFQNFQGPREAAAVAVTATEGTASSTATDGSECARATSGSVRVVRDPGWSSVTYDLIIETYRPESGWLVGLTLSYGDEDADYPVDLTHEHRWHARVVSIGGSKSGANYCTRSLSVA